MKEFCEAQVKDSTQRCQLLYTQVNQMLTACPVLSGLPVLESRCWTS